MWRDVADESEAKSTKQDYTSFKETVEFFSYSDSTRTSDQLTEEQKL